MGDGLFIFGVDANDVPKLRKERKDFKTDPRWDEIMDMIKKGTFGNDKFDALVDSVNDMKVTRGLNMPRIWLLITDIRT